MAFGFDDQSMYGDMTGLSMGSMPQSDPYGGGFAAPQYSDMGALSGGGMGGSGFGYQPDPLIDTAATASGQPPQQPTPQIGGTQSWFKQLLSGALMGLAGGAGAPDIGSAFAGGYGAVMQQREKERQMVIEQEKLKQQQQLFESNLADQNLRRLQIDQQMGMASKELQMKVNSSLATYLEGKYQQGQAPVFTADSLEEAQAQGESLDLGVHNTEPLLGPDGKWRIFAADPSQMQTTPVTYGNDVLDPAAYPGGLTVAMARKWLDDRQEADLKNDQTFLQNEQRMKEIQAQGAWNVKAQAAGRNPYAGMTMPKPGEVPENMNMALGTLGTQLGIAQKQLQDATTVGAGMSQDKAATARGNIVQLNMQYQKLASQNGVPFTPIYNFQVGDLITMNGKTGKVVSLNPDGSPNVQSVVR